MSVSFDELDVVLERGVKGLAEIAGESGRLWESRNADEERADIERIEALGVRAIAGNFASEEAVVRHDADHVADALLALGGPALAGRG